MEPRPLIKAKSATPLERALAARVVALRSARGWKQSFLAARSGLHWQRLSNLERGVHRFRVEEVVALAGAFSLDIDDLLHEIPTPGRSVAALLARLEAVAPPAEFRSLVGMLELLIAGCAARNSAGQRHEITGARAAPVSPGSVRIRERS
jgi:transcriptional regulator with XRE-family HTH domain